MKSKQSPFLQKVRHAIRAADYCIGTEQADLD